MLLFMQGCISQVSLMHATLSEVISSTTMNDYQMQLMSVNFIPVQTKRLLSFEGTAIFVDLIYLFFFFLDFP